MAQHFGRTDFIFTSESVSEGHPDKICDQISDALLDRFLTDNPESRVAVETLATTNRIVIAGETRDVQVSLEEQEHLVRQLVQTIGYNQAGFDWQKLRIENLLHHQSADIARGVDSGAEKDEGAGDQGIMFGFACTETENFMPAPIYYAHRILQALSEARRSGKEPLLRPDAKSQVSLRYENGVPVGVSSLVVSTQHAEEASQEQVREIIRHHATTVLPAGWMPPENEFYTNPTGQFIIGGPDGDAGLTGRKIIVDTYGGAAPHGGGAFSGKDPTKVDRSAAYVARYLAKNVVAAGLAERCTIQISYAIGVSHPLSFYLTTQGTGKVDDRALEKILPEMVNLTPRGIRKHLQLNQPIYLRTAAFGHFGRNPEKEGGFSWEKIDLVDALQRNFA
jgi:S-adenosylmethionine synthetase